MPRLGRPVSLEELHEEFGGELWGAEGGPVIHALEPPALGGEGTLCPVLRAQAIAEAERAVTRGAALLVDASLRAAVGKGARAWIHPFAAWIMAELLERARATHTAYDPAIGAGAVVHPTAVVYPGVTIEARVVIEPYAVVGGPGFGWVAGPDGRARPMPHLGGVVIGEDVTLGSHTTVHAGVLAPTRIGRRTKIDAHVHVGHNCHIGEDCFIAAQSGLAGSVRLGRGVQVGGQAGFADHVVVGDGARIAAKSGVIGDVPPGATFAGYPARPRARWLRSVAAADALADRRQRGNK